MSVFLTEGYIIQFYLEGSGNKDVIFFPLQFLDPQNSLCECLKGLDFRLRNPTLEGSCHELWAGHWAGSLETSSFALVAKGRQTTSRPGPLWLHGPALNWSVFVTHLEFRVIIFSK